MLKILKSLTLIAGLGIGGLAYANPVLETGDAGDLPGSAQGFGAGLISSISGGLGGDVDMFHLYIPDLSLFFATTVSGAGFDTQLFLFDSSGMGVVANDDDGGCGCFQSTLPAGFAAGSGWFYLAISQYNNDATSVGGLIFPSNPFSGVFGPTGPGGGSAISGWSGAPGGGYAYTIFLQGAHGVPEAPAFALLGLGLLALLRQRQRG